MKKILILLIRGYQATISPVLESVIGNACRYSPTCSEYSKEAISRFGVARGLYLSTKRFTSCHPGSKVYYDPVPTQTKN